MSKYKETVFYPPLEEKINIISHGIGMILSVIALVLLIIRSTAYGDINHIISFTVYGLSLLILYSASTIYHNSKTESIRKKLNIFDHASIYVLIAGTYTPFVIITLNGTVGWILFGIVWTFALVGVIIKLFFIGKYDILSTSMYVFMGWLMIFAAKPLINNLATEGLIWLLIGGISYTIGAVIFSIRKIKFNHAIFHVFVLIGSICHFISVYLYVVPVSL
jgi:hemolysin III